ncbi:hypothetical protein IC582_002080 [Cucumis melo]|uniref:S-protein homolog n=2 Tax=Cucumis melo TaxID=3656 RepID=A0A9I9DMX6_CUCME
MISTRFWNVIVLGLVMVVFVKARVLRMTLPPPSVTRYYIHVMNGLSNADLIVHCQSKDDDLGYHHLANRGDDYQWNFKENFWQTTLFWCKLEKQNVHVSFESFWPESKSTWLRDRCGYQGTCIWTAKDDGIYLRNMPANIDEFVHKWIPTK